MVVGLLVSLNVVDCNLCIKESKSLKHSRCPLKKFIIETN